MTQRLIRSLKIQAIQIISPIFASPTITAAPGKCSVITPLLSSRHDKSNNGDQGFLPCCELIYVYSLSLLPGAPLTDGIGVELIGLIARKFSFAVRQINV